MKAAVTALAACRLSRLDDDDLRLLLLIRHFELKLLRLFELGALNGTTHTCLGQEYVAVALTQLLDERDFVFSNHRGHGHYLARYQDPRGLLCEIMGREGAICNGVGGSQHILRERYLSTGVQGQSLPVATGAALMLKRSEPGQLACVYIGDGTWGEGPVYEALNLAQLWQVPLLVVVENNGIAQSTMTSAQMAGTVAGRAAAFGIRHAGISSLDLNEARRTVAPLVRDVRKHSLPLVVEFTTHRVGPHSKGDDSRSAAAIRHAYAHDWYPRYRACHPEQFAPWDKRMRDFIEEVAAEVTALPPASWDSP